jgi:xanthine/CO dehydrogenase XdhC/CoxF family maturation factor
VYLVQSREVEILFQKPLDVAVREEGIVLTAGDGRQRVEWLKGGCVENDLLIAARADML